MIGNTRANIANGGNAVLYDGWIFYNVNGTLYKARPDGSEKSKLAEGGAYYINVINGYVYYIGKFSNIYRMKIDGTGNQQLNSIASSNLIVMGDYMYYRAYEQSTGLYRMKIDGTEQIKITDKQMINAAIVGGSFIYNNVTSSSGVGSMYRMDLDGTVTLNYNADTVGNTKAFAVYDGWIYYNGSYGFGSNMGLYRVRLDGTDKVKLTSDPSIDYINASDSYVYYALNPSNANAGIYRVNLEELKNNPTTSGTTGAPTLTNPIAAEKIVEDKAIDINLVGDWIYYLNMGDYKYYRAKTDGTQRQVVN